MARVVLIVLDAVGAGAAPDAAAYGDEHAATLPHVARHVGGLALPTLRRLGLGNITPIPGCPPCVQPAALSGRLRERSAGKDSTTGHWELVGIITTPALPTYPHGFPAPVIDAFCAATGRGVLGNRAASGTAIIREFGAEHCRTGAWIVYTSADSVFQIAAHEQHVALDELYAACRAARRILVAPHNVGRVIARPFTGRDGQYTRTANRHDFSLQPPRPNQLTRIREAGHRVYAVGKINDIFAGVDIDTAGDTRSNRDAIAKTRSLLRRVDDGLVFVNLVETDEVYGHRNDPEGFAQCLREADHALGRLIGDLRDDDLLVVTSDHGCDPTIAGSDHTREYAILLAYSPAAAAPPNRRYDGEFADVGQTAYRWLAPDGPDPALPGTPLPIRYEHRRPR